MQSTSDSLRKKYDRWLHEEMMRSENNVVNGFILGI